MRHLRIIPSLLIQFTMFALNLGLGIHNLHTHFRAWPSFGAAGFIAGIMIVNLLTELHTRSLHNRIFQLQQEANRVLGVIEMSYSPEAQNLAKENFLKVAKILHAEYSVEAPWIKLHTKKGCFLIAYGAVHLMEGDQPISGTCFQNSYSLPPHEAVASAALLLHNSPQLFEWWRDHHGYPRA